MGGGLLREAEVRCTPKGDGVKEKKIMVEGE